MCRSGRCRCRCTPGGVHLRVLVYRVPVPVLPYTGPSPRVRPNLRCKLALLAAGTGSEWNRSGARRRIGIRLLQRAPPVLPGPGPQALCHHPDAGFPLTRASLSRSRLAGPLKFARAQVCRLLLPWRRPCLPSRRPVSGPPPGAAAAYNHGSEDRYTHITFGPSALSLRAPHELPGPGPRALCRPHSHAGLPSHWASLSPPQAAAQVCPAQVCPAIHRCRRPCLPSRRAVRPSSRGSCGLPPRFQERALL